MMLRRGLRRLRRMLGAAAVTGVVLAVAAAPGATSATISGAVSASTSFTTAAVGAPGSLAATPNSGFPTCNTEVLTWTAAANATAYKVEYQNNTTTAGGWTTLTASTPALTYTDANAGTHLNATVNYQVTPLRTPGTWTGTPTIVSVQCGIGPVTDLAITNQCTDIILTFTTPYNNTTTYKVEYSNNGGTTWLGGTNIAQTGTSNGHTYFDIVAPVATYGTTYIYRVTPNSGAGTVSNTSNSITWDNFHFMSVTNSNNGGTAGIVDIGDKTVAVFSKKVFQAGGVMVNNDVTVVGKKTFYLANAGSTTNNGLGLVTSGGNSFPNGTFTPTGGSGSFDATGTTYTYTQTTTTAFTQALALTAGTFTASTNTQCDPTPPTLTAGAIAKVALTAKPAGSPALSFGGSW